MRDYLIGPFLVQWADRNASSKVRWFISAIKTEAMECYGQVFDPCLEHYIGPAGIGEAVCTHRQTQDAHDTRSPRRCPPCFNFLDSYDFQLITMAYVAHDGLLRGGELVSLRWDVVSFEPDGAVRLTVRESKTSLVAEEVCFSPYERSGGVSFCGANLLNWYMEHRLTSGPVKPSSFLFPMVGGSKEARKGRYVADFQARLDLAGLPGQEAFSGHSFRAGGATDLFDGGAPRIIQLYGR